MWNLSERVDGDRCIQVLREHQSAVKVLCILYIILDCILCRQCLVKVDMDMFCSGGADICLWHKNGTLLSRHCRRENDRELMWLTKSHNTNV